MLNLETAKIGVLGLGYVGLPLAVAFGSDWPTVGFDIDRTRIDELREGKDRTLEVDPDELGSATKLSFSDDFSSLAECNVYVVTVPTPIDDSKRPDLTALLRASEMIGRVLKRGDLVIYESTVYPGATEEDCVPVLERISGLTFNVDFFAGYSPERANPGDREHRLATIMKVTSGSTPEVADFVDSLYRAVVTAGTHKAPSIKVAEAAKVIENTQRDLNIALVNELAIIFNRLGIDTQAVLEAAGTKWNFLPFRPGLVGGHCIGVDPYYLTHKAQQAGYHPEVILAGRRINDGMGSYVAGRLIKAMLKKKISISGSRVLMLGVTFKENCPDIRNTRVLDIIKELKDFGVLVDVNDPWASRKELFAEYQIDVVDRPPVSSYDAIVLSVPHQNYCTQGVEHIRNYGKSVHVLYDLKSIFSVSESDLRL
ncbi:MAG: Vi polysaccharide biosynthesis UDP-N-acetylglucosamine C-6 dehydrogenase TviB [Alphaproteobacteria bacterium]|nr:Vi polysaccharide biosynthesis UDP-N-acetylglucosamine C-6 dehydrogenase TviB [Rhizobiaceae bacterium]MBU4137077.1 Vi polysaccharide biosynthesis UDP-N-acetylglucosamine C-6 dehydrogenase TviB [Alphaproteobacteria bacterium]